jgi:Zn-dependent protease with chaperone function
VDATPRGDTLAQHLRLFGFILCVPLIGLAVAVAIDSRSNAELRQVVRQQNPSAPAGVVSQLTLARLCERQELRASDPCAFHRHIRLLAGTATIAAVSGLGLVMLIWVAGVAARRSRQILLRIFKPGLYVTATALIALVIAHAGIAIAVVYYGESALVHTVHPALLLGIAVGAVSGALAIVRHAFGIVRSTTTHVFGQSISRADAPGLWARVDSTATRMGALAPEHIVLGLDPTFFVTEAEVQCLDTSLRGRTLYCSAPLLRILSVDEFLSVVGHELAHFKGLDTKFSQHFFPIYRGTFDSLVALGQAANAGVTHLLALLPAFALFGYFLECFALAERRFSRQRELAADAAGAEVTSTTVASSALVKVHAFAGLWEEVHSSAIALLRRRQALINVSKTYASLAASRAASPILEDLAEQHLPHPTDTHPPLAERLTALGESVHSVSALALAVNPQPPAIALVSDPEGVEQQVSAAYKRWLQDHPGMLAALDVATAAAIVGEDVEVETIGDVPCRFCGRPLPAPGDASQETIVCETCGTRQAVVRAAVQSRA